MPVSRGTKSKACITAGAGSTSARRSGCKPSKKNSLYKENFPSYSARSEPGFHAHIYRSRLARWQDGISWRGCVAHAEDTDVFLVGKIAGFAIHFPTLAGETGTQSQQLVGIDRVGIAEVGIALVNEIESRTREETVG